MADRWYFTREQIRNSPSVRDGGIDCAKELGYRQQCANFIQDIGQRLSVSQLCINTSIVYMHRFYMFHSFKHFHRNTMAPCFIFLGAKVEEQPRKLEHVLKVAHRCLHRDSDAQFDVQSDEYMQMAQDLIDNESILLQTLGFDLSVDHPHTYVVKCAQMVKAAKELAQTSYFLATNSLHLTTFSIEEKPTVVACVCIFVACKWTSYEIPETQDKKHWWEYMDSSTSLEKIEEMSSYFIKILDSCPTRLKKKISTGPVIYKGGALQPKRDAEGESSKTSKPTDANANRTIEKIDGKSSNSVSSGDMSKDGHARKHDPSSDARRENIDLTKRHSKHANQSDYDRKNTEHHKHHKRKHSDHGKHHNDRSKQPEGDQEKRASQKRGDSLNPDKSTLPESKNLTSSSRPIDTNKSKVSQKEEMSAEAKFILSLPPLHHKHSLPDTDKSLSEIPAKKQKIDDGSSKRLKTELEYGSTGSHSGGSSDAVSGSFKKAELSNEKQTRITGDKNQDMYKHQQQTSEKSSHGQKHHSNSSEKHSKDKSARHDQYKSSSSRSAEGVERLHTKGKIENKTSPFKAGDDGSKTATISAASGQKSKHSSTPKKISSNEKKAHKSSNPVPKKNGHSKKTPTKSSSLSDESLLPPPPPPPSVEVSSLLGSPPPLPFGPPEPENKQIPAPPNTMDFEQNSQQKYSGQQPAVNQSGLVPGQIQNPLIQNPTQLQQTTLLQGHGQQGLFSLQHQSLQAPGLTGQPFQQAQAQFINSTQSVVSSSGSYGIPQIYYQGQQDAQTGSSDSSQVYGGQPLNTATMFSPSNIGLLTQPPRPPQGLILQQVVGLPPPPPLNLPPFPPQT